MNFRGKGLPRMQLYPMSKLPTLNVSMSLRLLFPIPQDTSKLMCLMGVVDCSGISLWNVSCTGTRSDRLRSISMKVFLMIRINEAPLSIGVLATLCRPIGNLTTNSKFLSDSYVSGWSSGLNDISTSHHFIILPGSMDWAKLISRSSFFPCVFEAMDMLHLKITLISPMCSSPLGSTQRCSPHRGPLGASTAGSDIFLLSRKVLHSTS
jgi:hypothetical protein